MRSAVKAWVLGWALLVVSSSLPAWGQDAAPAPPSNETAAAEEAPLDAVAGPELTAPDLDADTMALLVLPLTVDELAELGSAWQNISKELTAGVVDIRLQIQSVEPGTPEAEALVEDLSAALEKRNAAFANLGIVTEHLAVKGGDEAVVSGLRAYRAAIVATETQQTDWRTLTQLGIDWAQDPDGGVQLAIDVGIVIGSIVGLLIVARLVRGLSRRSFRRIPNISKLLVAFLAGIVYWLVLAFGLLIVLNALGINITPLFALVGGATFVLAFAMQDTLANLASGVMIIINRPFDEGDYVTVAGVGGTVKAVSIVSTTVTTPDNQVIVIPNSKVWGDIITNVTASELRRVDLVFGIGYSDSIAEAQEVLERVTKAHPLVLTEPAPVIRVNALAASSVDFVCRPWTRSADYWTVYWDLTRQMKEAFDAAGISIPFPQSDMHLHVAGPLSVAGVGAAPAPTAGGSGQGVGRPAGAPDFASGDEAITD